MKQRYYVPEECTSTSTVALAFASAALIGHVRKIFRMLIEVRAHLMPAEVGPELAVKYLFLYFFYWQNLTVLIAFGLFFLITHRSIK